MEASTASVDELAALVRRLAQSLRKAAPGNELPDQAVDYLKRTGLQGSPIRADKDCPSCRASCSWGMPDRAACAGCVGTPDGKGSLYAPLNG